jgi:hypothetical protein
MDQPRRSRLDTLLLQNRRRRRAPVLIEACERIGVSATAVSDERFDEVLSWVRAVWKQPRQEVDDLEGYITSFIDGMDEVIIMDFWAWDKAIVLVVSADELAINKSRIQTIYPDGLLFADLALSRALIVHFDSHDHYTNISLVGPEP